MSFSQYEISYVQTLHRYDLFMGAHLAMSVRMFSDKLVKAQVRRTLTHQLSEIVYSHLKWNVYIHWSGNLSKKHCKIGKETKFGGVCVACNPLRVKGGRMVQHGCIRDRISHARSNALGATCGRSPGCWTQRQEAEGGYQRLREEQQLCKVAGAVEMDLWGLHTSPRVWDFGWTQCVHCRACGWIPQKIRPSVFPYN